MMSRPIATHSIAGIRFGGGVQPPMVVGIRRVTSKKPTGTRIAPRIAPTLLPRPPTGEGPALLAWPGMLRTLYGDDERYVQTYWSGFGKETYHVATLRDLRR